MQVQVPDLDVSAPSQQAPLYLPALLLDTTYGYAPFPDQTANGRKHQGMPTSARSSAWSHEAQPIAPATPHPAIRFPVRGILRHPSVATAGHHPQHENYRVRFSSPQRFVFSPDPSSISASMQSLDPQPQSSALFPQHLRMGRPDAYSTPRSHVTNQNKSDSSTRMTLVEQEDPTDEYLQYPLDDQASLPNHLRYSIDGVTTTDVEDPGRLNETARKHIPAPLAIDQQGILAGAALSSSKKSRPAYRESNLSGKDLIRNLERAAEEDDYDSDELNLRPLPPIPVKAEVCP